MFQLTVVVTSAIVAATVTLLVDFAIRPKLEVRKDRILERDRARRLLVRELVNVRSSVFTTAVRVERAGKKDCQRQLADLANTVAKVSDEVLSRQAELPYFVRTVALSELAHLDGFLTSTLAGFRQSDRTPPDYSEILQGHAEKLLQTTLAYFNTPLWQPIQRYRSRRSLVRHSLRIAESTMPRVE